MGMTAQPKIVLNPWAKNFVSCKSVKKEASEKYSIGHFTQVQLSKYATSRGVCFEKPQGRDPDGSVLYACLQSENGERIYESTIWPDSVKMILDASFDPTVEGGEDEIEFRRRWA